MLFKIIYNQKLITLDIFNLSQESLWLLTVVYDLGLALLLYRFFGKYGLYVAVVLGIVLGNLQGGKVSELIIFGTAYKVSMGAILYSGIYFATDVLNEKYNNFKKIIYDLDYSKHSKKNEKILNAKVSGSFEDYLKNKKKGNKKQVYFLNYL